MTDTINIIAAIALAIGFIMLFISAFKDVVADYKKELLYNNKLNKDIKKATVEHERELKQLIPEDDRITWKEKSVEKS